MPTTFQIGCHIDGNYSNVDEFNREIIAFAIGLGFTLDDDDYEIASATDDEPAYDSDALNDLANDAVQWLNDYPDDNPPIPPYTHWEIHESCLMLWPDVDHAKHCDDVICTGHKDTSPVFELVINDHGNATLYRLERVEVWGVV